MPSGPAWGGYEYQRACKRCGREWFVAGKIAEAQPVKKARFSGLFTPMFGEGRQQIRVQEAIIAAQNAALAQAQGCPACGSNAYWQRPVPITD